MPRPYICPICGGHRIWDHTLEQAKACRRIRNRQNPTWAQAMAYRAAMRPKQNTPVQLLPSGKLTTEGKAKNRLPKPVYPASHRWTSETGRKAVEARWRRQRRRKGRYQGLSAKPRPAVKRAPLRAKHADRRDDRTWYDVCERQWWHDGRRISERYALGKLGYLAYLPQPPQSYRIVKRARGPQRWNR